jgi:hypothetical protein
VILLENSNEWNLPQRKKDPQKKEKKEEKKKKGVRIEKQKR